MQSRAQRLDTAKKDREAKRLAGFQAYFALFKLVKTFEAIENLARHFNNQLREAKEEGRGALEPYDIYKAVVGAPHEFEDVSAGEILFLAKSHGEMIAKIGEIQQRARNNEVIAKEYSNDRRSLDHFMLEHISQTTTLDGPRLTMEIGSVIRMKVDVLQGRLNQMIVPLIISLDEDRQNILQLINDYIEVARSEFGDDFPAKGLELRGNQKNADP